MAVQNPFKSGSIAGNLPLATQKAKGISPLPGIMPIAPPTTAKPAPLRIDAGIGATGDPVRAQAMQSQYNQPVTKGLPQNGIGGGIAAEPAQPQPQGKTFLRGLADFGNGIVNTTVGGAEALLAGPLDWGRNGITTLSGGDPQSLPGGPTAFRDTANRRLNTGIGQLSGTASAVGDTALAGLGANRRDGSDPSQPAGAVQPAPVDQKLAKFPAAGGIGAITEPERKATGTSANFGETGIAGVVGRRGANGVMEFSNDPSAVAGATGKAGGGIGDGMGTLSIMSGGREGMERNLAAAEIIRQTRRDNAGGGLAIVGDSTRGRGFDQQQSERIANADWDRQQQAKLTARQERGIAGGLQDFQNNQLQRQATEQQIAARGLELQKQERLNGLLAGLDDSSRSPEERAQLREAYLQMTTPLKDQRMVSLGEVVDPATGQKFKSPLLVDLVKGTSTRIDGGQQAPAITPQQLADLDEVTQELAKKPGISQKQIDLLNERREAAKLKPLPTGGA